MKYVALAEGKNTRYLYPAESNLREHIRYPDKDYYRSIFLYNENHYKQWKETRSLAGIKDVETSLLVWDFDSVDDTEKARADTIVLCTRLINLGVPKEQINIAFSGMKGFSVLLKTDKAFSPTEFENINKTLAEGLATNDTSIFDAQRIFRLIKTKHDKSGLYKLPITLEQLSEVPTHQIKEWAKDPDNGEDIKRGTVTLPDKIYEMRLSSIVEPTKKTTEIGDIDFKFKPKGFSNCKFALLNGVFPPGHRDNAFMAIAATCRAQGYPKEITYNMCKGAARLQAARYEQEPKAKEEIWRKVENVYGNNWDGAQYSCKNQEWLKSICQSLGTNKCKHDETPNEFVQVSDMSRQFEDYSLNIEKNTIKTGLIGVDDKVQITIGMPVGLLGSPGSGKTSLSLDILNSTSKAGISSVFFSMDMYGPLIYQKQIQKETGLSGPQIHELWKHNKKKSDELKSAIQENYKNVKFSTKAGHSVQDMRDIITEHQDTTGDKVKLVLIDYLECIAGPYSDSTANTSKIAGELRDFATEMGIANIVLLQPPKSAGDASSALTSMRQIKGSSMLEQSFRVILSIHREGFGPSHTSDDRFLTINCLKNTMGELFSQDYYWDGKYGKIRGLDEEGERDLENLRRRKKEEKSSSGDDSWERI